MTPPSDRQLRDLEMLVRSRVGLDLQSVGPQGLLRAVYQYGEESRLDSGDECIARLLNDQTEFETFVESLIVPETWFFRDTNAFRCLQDFALRRVQPLSAARRLRVLSIPCCTGEEPYSIGMALLAVGILREQFTIDAADLSRRALDKAETGVFGKSSFRGDERAFPGLCERYLLPHGPQVIAGPQVRSTVRFRHANLVSPTLLADEPRYDVVFCRNVLIYLHADARRIVLANLQRLLLPDGLLQVGHAESKIAMDAAFRPVGRDDPFAFFAPVSDRLTVSDAPSPAPPQNPARPQPKSGHRRRLPQAPDRVNDALTAPSRLSGGGGVAKHSAVDVRRAGQTPTDDLARARAAADAGRLDEAVRVCDEILAADPANAEALYLIGLVWVSRGQSLQAEGVFQKTLYLDPRHQGAMVHLMLLAQRRGDEQAAARLRQRAQRTEDEEERG